MKKAFDISKYAATLDRSAAAGAARDIETITTEIVRLKQDAGSAILGIGERLIEAKEMLPHGAWLPWLEERVEFSERTARNFMRLAREWTNRQALADLGAAKALTLLALPPGEREAFMAENDVVDMTSRELEKAIKERDEARKAAERAKVDAKAAEEARASMEQSLQAANELLDRTRADVKTAHDVTAELEQQLAELKAAPVEVAIATVDQEALAQARAEGEAAKAEEIAQLQAKLDKAKAAKERADEKRRNAEASVNILKLQLGEAENAKARAAALADPEVAKFQVYFDQAQETVNKMRGLLLKFRGREDQTAAEKLTRAILALSDAMKEAAQ